eukprot:CAMPEP_0175418020 /NCGR_PEP_ID=MMETSP0095-20121207/45499_1 /TAXON_ID=311494 /ORGANISM="Alexandrium monilatum, Strain CCMP3105" /LENGTH=70 /DNA_ID=CAMNT_0016717169 /DNA_START=10 /DNA_END=218 /DNA_ORIENTATION=-
MQFCRTAATSLGKKKHVPPSGRSQAGEARDTAMLRELAAMVSDCHRPKVPGTSEECRACAASLSRQQGSP